MATQRKSQGKGWHLIRQRASNIMRRITKRQGLQKHAEKTQREAVNSPLQEDAVVLETPETQVPAIGSRLPSQNNNSTSLGTWLDAFEQTQSLYPWLARGSSFINDNETPLQVSNLESHELGRSDSSTAGETETATVLPCGHMFGKDCLALWRTANKGGFSCPTCRSTLIFSSCKHAIPGLVVGKTADVPLTSPEGGRIPTYCNDCRLSKIRDGCVELARLIYDDFEYTEAECRRAAWHMVPLAVEAAQRATVERVMGSWGWGNTEMLV
uniref:RING-type domain-containing protein n=1 Tax=Pyricularia oryzae (strain P131) TaxID=1143193 RepID=L7J9E8_PYRO1